MLRLLTMLALAGCIAGVAGGRLLAQTLRTPKGNTQTGQVRLAIARADRLAIGATGIAPGDHTQRTFDLKNKGKAAINAVSLTTSASPSSALDSDPVHGLQLQIDKCSKAWKRHKRPERYTCGRSVTSVVPARPVIGSNIVLTNIAELQQPGKAVHLLLTLTLPPTAPPELANLRSSLSYSFTGA